MNKKISDLQSSIKLNESDLFLVCSKETSSLYRSSKTSFINIFNEILNLFENISVFKPKGNWTFTKKLIVSNKIIANELNKNNKTVACNLNYLNNNFLRTFNDLSSTVYSPLMPSYVGEIIFSTTLKNEIKVKKYYGEHTSWIKIPGRFIYAVDNSDSNLSSVNIKAGETTTLLSINNIPNHSHRFEPKENTTYFEATYTLTPKKSELDSVCVADEEKNAILVSDSGSAYGVFKRTNRAADCTEGTGHIYGNNGANAIIKENNYRGKAHNNMPPFYCVYIWRRIK